MSSLRTRLFIILVAATSLIWLFAIGWIYVDTKHEVENVLDSRLEEAARMVSSLVTTNNVASPSERSDSPHILAVPNYERQLSCQIWSLDGRLVARTRGAPDSSLSDSKAGFSQRLIDGDTWRVFTMEAPGRGIRVLVGDRLGIRAQLVDDLIEGLLAPTALIIPLLGFLIWASLNRGLRPLRTMASELQGRNADDMSPIEPGRVPTEIRPVVTSLNGLFSKVESARQHEREITAFAAHELRTPLAGLRTQAQIAISTMDATTRDTALSQILVAVDRTTRLVRQLLSIAKLDASDNVRRDGHVNVGAAVEEVVDMQSIRDHRIHVVVDPALHETFFTANHELLVLALRNLHENAVHHMPRGGTVRWHVKHDTQNTIVSVEDEGPGIPEEELALVTNRFFRGRHKSASGSGLGLAIVELALRANGASLNLANRTDRLGLRAEIIWPAPSRYFQSIPTSGLARSPSPFHLKSSLGASRRCGCLLSTRQGRHNHLSRQEELNHETHDSSFSLCARASEHVSACKHGSS
jgi:two-component system sensor histidine kinase QseC